MQIKRIKAKKILNSRREPTIKIIVRTDKAKGVAMAPSGASRGEKEVIAWPKGGVKEAVEFVNEKLNNDLKGFELNSFDDFKKLGSALKKYDSTKNLAKIGGNVIVALEFALLKALSNNKLWSFLNPDAEKLPRPLGNCVGGGAHVQGKNKPVFQEFLLISLDAKKFPALIEANERIYELMKKKLSDPRYNLILTDEGALSPDFDEIGILDILKEVRDRVSKEFGFKIKLGLDIAASQFYDKKTKRYIYRNKKLSGKEQIAYVRKLIERYDLIYVEDPLMENDFKGFAALTKAVRKRAFICGDDLICTNSALLRKAVKLKAINAVIVKPNQIGSIIRTKELVDIAKSNKIIPVISHRSGETEDATIAHLGVGWGIPIIKTGIIGKERKAKLKELLKIEKEIRKIHGK